MVKAEKDTNLLSFRKITLILNLDFRKENKLIINIWPLDGFFFFLNKGNLLYIIWSSTQICDIAFHDYFSEVSLKYHWNLLEVTLLIISLGTLYLLLITAMNGEKTLILLWKFNTKLIVWENYIINSSFAFLRTWPFLSVHILVPTLRYIKLIENMKCLANIFYLLFLQF